MEIDWTACELIECVHGKCSGSPVVKGTRIFAETAYQSYMTGESPAEIQENFPSLSLETIEALIAYGKAHDNEN